VFLASIGWLWSRRPIFDAIAVSSAEIGVLFTGLALVAGSIWAKPTWGVWWTWEPRLITTAVMFVMYVGYLLLRGLSTDFERRATRAAILGVVLVIDVPIVHLSVLWANSLHQLPTVLRAAGSPALVVLERIGARRALMVAALGAAVVIGTLAATNLAPNTVYYLTPTEARERGVTAGRTVRLGGLVKTGSLSFQPISFHGPNNFE